MLGLSRGSWIILILGIVNAMMGINTSVVNAVLPVIGESLGADLSSIEWVVMVYVLANSVLLLIFGRVGDILGYKRVFILGLVVFTVASILCGLSPNVWFLIGFRVLQSTGYSMIMSSSNAIVTRTRPATKRGRDFGILVMISYVGMGVGPTIGGFIAEHAGWRYIFFLSLPIGVVAMAMAAVLIPRLSDGGRREPFDIAGAATMVVGLGSLILAVSKGQEAGWSSSLILGLFVAGVVFIVAFLRLENLVRSPLLDLSLLRIRLFSAAAASSMLNYVCLTAVTFLVPFYLVQARGFAPSTAGLLVSAQSISSLIMSPFAGHLSDRIGSRSLATGGMALMAGGTLMVGLLGAGSGETAIMVPLVLVGSANALFTSPNSSAIMGAAPHDRQGVASGVVGTARNLGMVFGVAISGAVFATALAERTAELGGAPEAFYGAFQLTFFVIAGVALLGAITSSIRGQGQTKAGPAASAAAR